MLHVYISYGSVALSSAASPVLAAHRTPGVDAVHKPAPGRPSETHDIAMNDAGAVDGGELVLRENCRIGEKLWVMEDAAEVRRLTDKSSGISWNDDMADCCGTQGEVVAVLDKYVGMRLDGFSRPPFSTSHHACSSCPAYAWVVCWDFSVKSPVAVHLLFWLQLWRRSLIPAC